MEGWKLADLDSLSPIVALSITAHEWGLQILPYNIIGVEGTWPSFSEPESPSPPQQSDSLVEVWQYEPQDTYLSINATSIIPCRGSGPHLPDSWYPSNQETCDWILEDIGRNTTATGSDIASLACGLSFLISVLLTALIMGCIFSKPRGGESSKDPENSHNVLDQAIVKSYNPPAPAATPPAPTPPREKKLTNPPVSDTERAYLESSATPDIRRCINLLRELYSLDLELWGMEGCVTDDEPGDGQEGKRQAAIEQRAEAIFDEVTGIVHGLYRAGDARVGVRWTEEERRCLEEIYRIVVQQGVARRRNVQ